MSSESEADLDEQSFRAIAAFAAGPPPAVALASEDDVRELVLFLASTLKAPRLGVETSKVKLGAYRIALTGQSKAALNYAAQTAIRTLEWLPTPAELLNLAAAHFAPERAAHEKAKAMTFNRRQRLFEERLRNIRDRKLLPDELAALDDHTARVAQTQGTLIIRLDGSRQYRTRETIEAHEADLEARAASLRDERDIHADEAPTVGGNGGHRGDSGSGEGIVPNRGERAHRASVGDLAADLLAGMEVQDGE